MGVIVFRDLCVWGGGGGAGSDFSFTYKNVSASGGSAPHRKKLLVKLTNT